MLLPAFSIRRCASCAQFVEGNQRDAERAYSEKVIDPRASNSVTHNKFSGHFCMRSQHRSQHRSDKHLRGHVCHWRISGYAVYA